MLIVVVNFPTSNLRLIENQGHPMLFKKKPTNPDRVGLSLHKHLTPHVLEMSGTHWT
jgi:hypothetical protein